MVKRLLSGGVLSLAAAAALTLSGTAASADPGVQSVPFREYFDTYAECDARAAEIEAEGRFDVWVRCEIENGRYALYYYR
ncbi:hypothetical protein [Salininema proteolyticum]|uniref:Secreted protein n=1 Tax=Salininema proteolyticum TaxID=1607685 RepID=A0ABV8U4J2_9ACTN